MKTKVLSIGLLLVLTLPAIAPALAQSATSGKEKSSTAKPVVTPAASPSVAPTVAPAEPARPLCGGQPCDEQTPRVVVTVPPSVPAPPTLYDRIVWGATVLLAVVGYIGVMMGLSLLKKIERQTRATEAAATAAADSAYAARLQAQALVDATRPWLVVTAEPTLHLENGFRVMVTNRGKSPARLESLAEQMMICTSEEQLPAQPTFQVEKHDPQVRAIVLMPGESHPIRAFSRDEVKSLCESTEQFARVETWQEKIFLYGKVEYRDLAELRDRTAYVSTWCCWYIHGQQKSGLVMAGPQNYNRHT